MFLLAQFELNYEVHKKRSANFFGCITFDEGHRKKHSGCCSTFVRYSIWVLCFFLIMLSIVVNAKYIAEPSEVKRARTDPDLEPRRRFESKGADFHSGNLDDFIDYFPFLVLLVFTAYTGLSLWRYGSSISTDVRATLCNPWMAVTVSAAVLLASWLVSGQYNDEWHAPYAVNGAELFLCAMLGHTASLIHHNLEQLQRWSDSLQSANKQRRRRDRASRQAALETATVGRQDSHATLSASTATGLLPHTHSQRSNVPLGAASGAWSSSMRSGGGGSNGGGSSAASVPGGRVSSASSLPNHVAVAAALGRSAPGGGAGSTPMSNSRTSVPSTSRTLSVSHGSLPPPVPRTAQPVPRWHGAPALRGSAPLRAVAEAEALPDDGAAARHSPVSQPQPPAVLRSPPSLALPADAQSTRFGSPGSASTSTSPVRAPGALRLSAVAGVATGSAAAGSPRNTPIWSKPDTNGVPLVPPVLPTSPTLASDEDDDDFDDDGDETGDETDDTGDGAQRRAALGLQRLESVAGRQPLWNLASTRSRGSSDHGPSSVASTPTASGSPVSSAARPAGRGNNPLLTPSSAYAPQSPSSRPAAAAAAAASASPSPPRAVAGHHRSGRSGRAAMAVSRVPRADAVNAGMASPFPAPPHTRHGGGGSAGRHSSPSRPPPQRHHVQTRHSQRSRAEDAHVRAGLSAQRAVPPHLRK